jgi:hypothetical protein
MSKSKRTLAAEDAVATLNAAWPLIVTLLAPVARQLANVKGAVRVWRGLAPEGAIPTEASADGKRKEPLAWFIFGDKGKRLKFANLSDIGHDITLDPSLNMIQSLTALVAAALQLANPGDADAYYSESFRAALTTAGFNGAPPRGLTAGPMLAEQIAGIVAELKMGDAEFPILQFSRTAVEKSRLVRFVCSDHARQQKEKSGGSTALTCPTFNLAGATWEPILLGKSCYLAAIMGTASPCGGKGTIVIPAAKTKKAAKVEAATKTEDVKTTKTQSKRKRKEARAAAKANKASNAQPGLDVTGGEPIKHPEPQSGETEDVKTVEAITNVA